MKNIKAIIFDFDGVIIDSNEVKKGIYFKLFENFESHKEIINLVDKEFGKQNRKIQLTHILEKLGIENQLETYLKKFSEFNIQVVSHVNEIEGAINLIKKLKEKNILVFINTAGNIHDLESVLKNKNWINLFDELYAFDNGSKTENINNILIKYNLKKNEIYFIGDGNTDLQAAINSNVKFIGVLNETNRDKFTNNKNIEKLVNNMKEFSKYLFEE